MSSALVSRPVMAVEKFVQEHGDVETWSSVDWEVHQNLTEIAVAHGPIGSRRQKVSRRTAAVAVLTYAMVLYAVTEIVSAIRGPRVMTELDYHLNNVIAGPLARAEDCLRFSGDLLVRQRIWRNGYRAVAAIDRLTARLARG
ncbi:hypothetical protein [Streptomyces graminilatus]|uniref:hypothetical protein n=1 Tax=Streptomyces graminilatus TaxID=1464070 RepID=UPI0006E4375C|nr:hypothetical protein [Streptomyces graminilatus]